MVQIKLRNISYGLGNVVYVMASVFVPCCWLVPKGRTTVTPALSFVHESSRVKVLSLLLSSTIFGTIVPALL